MLNLNIGSGERSKNPDWIGVDAFTDADVRALMWDLPFKDNTVDNIFCNNALEHISKFQVVPTLREWNRVLKPEGKVQIIVPDLEWACKFWVSHQDVNWSLDLIYGNQMHEGEYHKTGYSSDILKVYLDVAGGFGIHKIEYFGGEVVDDNGLITHVSQRNISLEAYKLPLNYNRLQSTKAEEGSLLVRDSGSPLFIVPSFKVPDETSDITS